MKKIGYKDQDEVDPEIFDLKFKESSKVLDYCKTQQWQIAILIIGFGLSVLNLYFNWLEVANSNYIHSMKILLIISFSMILLVGLLCICLLQSTSSRHRNHIDQLNLLLILPTFLQKDIKIQEKKQHKYDIGNVIFPIAFGVIILVFTVIIFFFICWI